MQRDPVTGTVAGVTRSTLQSWAGTHLDTQGLTLARWSLNRRSGWSAGPSIVIARNHRGRCPRTLAFQRRS